MSILGTFLHAINPLSPAGDTLDLLNTAQTDVHAAREGGGKGPIPFYGNYGGPNYGGGKPIDGLDRAFQAHDKAYGDHGDFDHASDVVLGVNIALNSLDPNASPRERLYGAAATSIFAGLAPFTSAWSSVGKPIADAKGDPVQTAVNLATAPITAAATVATGVVNAVGNAVDSIIHW